jgi:hypothetical protein
MQNHNSRTIRKASVSYHKNDTELLEKLAELEHEQFSNLVIYIFSVLLQMNKKEFQEKLNIWKKQSQTLYSELSERDKEKDRIWARKVLKIIQEI